MRKRDQINFVSFSGKEVYLGGIETIFKMDMGQWKNTPKTKIFSFWILLSFWI